MNDNRIGSACWYRTYDGVRKAWSEWRGGRLRAWSTDNTEGESGFGNFPVGVIEDDKTACMKSIYVEWICFATVPPS